MRLRWVALLALLSLATPALAQRQVVIYRCTDASGAVSIQNDVPCTKGSKQQKQVIDVPTPMPSYQSREARMPVIVAREQAEAEAEAEAEIAEATPAPVAEEERKPPPSLFQCTSYEQNIYLTEDDAPQQRCAPMQVVGLDGRPMAGAAQACQNVPDQCQPVPGDALCKSWQRRVDEAKFRWKFADPADDLAREVEYTKLLGALRNSSCGQ